jgi:hypothetical protein
MAIRDDFAPGEVLAAADLNDTFGSKIPYAYGTATPSTTVDGFVWYDENETPPAPKFWDGAAFQGIGGGKVLQVVRATDTTQRTSSSSTVVDVTGMSVTITPQKSTSAVLIIANISVNMDNASGACFGNLRITDSSANAISGAEGGFFGSQTTNSLPYHIITLMAYATPATTSATTYKLQFKTDTGSPQVISVNNNTQTGQMYAIEVSA